MARAARARGSEIRYIGAVDGHATIVEGEKLNVMGRVHVFHAVWRIKVILLRCHSNYILTCHRMHVYVPEEIEVFRTIIYSRFGG